MTRRARGFLTADVLVGLFIIATLAAALGVALGRQRKAVTHTGDTREAVHLAELTIVRLQTDRPPPANTIDTAMVVHRLEEPFDNRHEWVEVVATVRGRSASLVGVVPKEARQP